MVTLLCGAQTATYLFVASAARDTATRQITRKVDESTQVFERLLRQHVDEQALAVKLLVRDYAFVSTFGRLSEDTDPVARETLRSALENYRARIRSTAFLRLVSLEGEVLADTMPTQGPPDPALVAAAEHSPDLQATSVEALGDRLYIVVARPVLTPEPAAWILAGFPLDEALAEESSRLSGLEIAFSQDGVVVASTPALRNLHPPAPSDGIATVDISGTDYLGRATALPCDPSGRTCIVMLRSLAEETAPFRRLEKAILLLSAAALLVSAILALLVSRSVTRPVEALSQGAADIERGEYATRVPVTSQDELGRLGTAFNRMAAGLEERDRVRDLLGRTVSPAIAAQLVDANVDLGGEMREVTVLFSDLRGFTTFSETQSPKELLAQLNAYFTAITAAVEESGGVVDKFIGDAVMAIFGAPVAMPDHADRALAAARGILEAEGRVNIARTAAGLPPLRTGIGIATGVVVAGNIGSPTRYNYTVVGNEVNLASRLEGMTKDAAFQARVICSDSTRAALRDSWPLRDLGQASIRGKAEPIRLWAVD